MPPEPVYTIKKVLNSSVVLAVDERGVERVLLGKGIGYGHKAGEVVPPDAPDQVFVGLGDADRQGLLELLSAIPPDCLELTREVVALAAEAGLDLDPHIYLALTDHLHFAVVRARQGMRVVNRFSWEMRTLYPRQWAIGLRTVELLRERLGAELPEDEAANVAFHLVNADSSAEHADPMQVVSFISSVLQIVTHTTAAHFEQDDLNRSRFVSHLQYFAERLFSGRLLTSPDDFLHQQLAARYPRAMGAADRVALHVEQTYGVTLPKEELAYVALHVARVAPE
ncbi:PRD domain-containing protein [Streptomyces sp. NPDC093111]|uniref:PRD domain-containing protein n=1 Tax=Streptomyces sp. NPDC093111 TaxID=3154978 RepID=UPI0034203543